MSTEDTDLELGKTAGVDPATEAPDGEAVAARSSRDVDETRRALIRAGWVLPAVLAVQLPTPTDAFASSAHVDAHVDETPPHVDV
jgi:hypothetical protein